MKNLKGQRLQKVRLGFKLRLADSRAHIPVTHKSLLPGQLVGLPCQGPQVPSQRSNDSQGPHPGGGAPSSKVHYCHASASEEGHPWLAALAPVKSPACGLQPLPWASGLSWPKTREGEQVQTDTRTSPLELCICLVTKHGLLFCNFVPHECVKSPWMGTEFLWA